MSSFKCLKKIDFYCCTPNNFAPNKPYNNPTRVHFHNELLIRELQVQSNVGSHYYDASSSVLNDETVS